MLPNREVKWKGDARLYERASFETSFNAFETLSMQPVSAAVKDEDPQLSKSGTKTESCGRMRSCSQPCLSPLYGFLKVRVYF